MKRPAQNTTYKEVIEFLGEDAEEFESCCMDKNKVPLARFIEDWQKAQKIVTICDVITGCFLWVEYKVEERMHRHIDRLALSGLLI